MNPIRTRSVARTLSAFMLAAAGTAAQAGTLAIQPAISNVTVGNAFTVAVVGTGFAEAIVGGGFNLSFDPTVLQFSTGTSAIAAIWEFVPSLGSTVVNSPSLHTQTNLSFASFVNNPTGNFAVATIGFMAVGAGNSALTLSPSAIFDFSDTAANAVIPIFGRATVVAVPEPGALLLMLGGLVGLSPWLRRRQTPAGAVSIQRRSPAGRAQEF